MNKEERKNVLAFQKKMQCYEDAARKAGTVVEAVRVLRNYDLIFTGVAVQKVYGISKHQFLLAIGWRYENGTYK
jgi:hypothetical protein